MDKDSLIRYIQNVLPISNGKAQQLVEKFKPKKISKGDYLLKEGVICNESHFIEEGIMRAYIYDINGNDITTAFCTNKMLTGDFLSFFKREPSKEYIQAITDCKTWYVTYEDMQENFHTIPEYREFGRLNIINHYSKLKERMLAMMQQNAEQRYADLLTNDPEVVQNVPLKYIATYLGITDTSLSRIRKEFAKK